MLYLCNNQGMSQHKPPLEGASALLSFTVENAHSYRDETEFSMVATRFAKDDIRRDLSMAGLKNPVGVLPVAGILGANASGKTTFLRAMADMRNAVGSSFRVGDNTSGFMRLPFLLDPKSTQKPSIYAVEVVINGVHWQYGFEADDERIIEEYAYYYPKGRRALLFHRNSQNIYFGPVLRQSSNSLRSILRTNSLVLSVAGATGNNNLNPLFQWFKNNLIYIDTQSRESRIHDLLKTIQDENESERKRIIDLINTADLGITDIQYTTPDPLMIERAKKAIQILTGEDREIELEEIRKAHFIHRGVNSDVELDSSLESTGTLAWTSFLGPVINALSRGILLLIDELDSSLHPKLVGLLIRMFQSDITNPNCSQLIFNSHDIEVLSNRHITLGRDQIWFTEKNDLGISNIYSLSDFKPRKNEKFDINYIIGRYGAIPLVPSSEIDLNIEQGIALESVT